MNSQLPQSTQRDVQVAQTSIEPSLLGKRDTKTRPSTAGQLLDRLCDISEKTEEPESEEGESNCFVSVKTQL